jgi:hypothetical protein
MATSTRTGALTILQNNQTGAANGTIFDISNSMRVTVEVSGVFTGITCNFEASVDVGVTWQLVALEARSVIPVVNALTAIAPGLYVLVDARGVNRFRARTSVAAPTGAMTVKAIASSW